MRALQQDADFENPAYAALVHPVLWQNAWLNRLGHEIGQAITTWSDCTLQGTGAAVKSPGSGQPASGNQTGERRGWTWQSLDFGEALAAQHRLDLLRRCHPAAGHRRPQARKRCGKRVIIWFHHRNQQPAAGPQGAADPRHDFGNDMRWNEDTGQPGQIKSILIGQMFVMRC